MFVLRIGGCEREMRISQMEIPYLNANSIFVTSTKKKKVRSFPQVCIFPSRRVELGADVYEDMMTPACENCIS